MSWRSALLVVVLCVGCHNPNYGGTQIYPPAERETRPTFTQFRDCLVDVFTRRMPAETLEALHQAVLETGTVWFQVPIESSYGAYHHDHFVSYLSGPSLLVSGRIRDGTEVTDLVAWYVASPQEIEKVAPPQDLEPPPVLVPDECPSCGEPLKPTWKNCSSCRWRIPR